MNIKSILSFLIICLRSLDEPSAPGKPEIADYDNTSATLAWTAPENDGGRPVTHYTVELKSKFQVDWLEVAKTEDDTCLCKVPDLKERMVYQFRIVAHNKAGPSKPSEPSENHLCKHKNRKYLNLVKGPLFEKKVGPSPSAKCKPTKFVHNKTVDLVVRLISSIEVFS